MLRIWVFSRYLLAFRHEWRSLIGYASHWLFCCRQQVAEEGTVVDRVAAASLRFRSAFEENLDKVLND